MATLPDNKIKRFPRCLQRGFLFFAVFSLSFVAGCSNGKKNDELHNYIKTVKERKPTPVEPLPAMKPLTHFAYPAISPRDPFKSIAVKKDTQVTGPNVNRKKELLETFPLDTLRMVGTLREDNKFWAIVSAPDEGAYRVTIGSYMGQNFGKVVAVTDKTIKLEETIKISGEWGTHPVTLNLQTQE